MSTPGQSDASVSAEDAYTAARDRAARTTDALILAEARIITLTRERDTAVRQLEDVRAELMTYQVPAAGEEVRDGKDSDPVGYTAAVGQAD